MWNYLHHNLLIPPTANTTRKETQEMKRGQIKLCNRKCENSLKSRSKRKHPLSQNTISCSDRFLLKWRRAISHIYTLQFERLAYQACAYRSCAGAQVSLWAEDNEMSEEKMGLVRNSGNLPEREGQHFWGREDCGVCRGQTAANTHTNKTGRETKPLPRSSIFPEQHDRFINAYSKAGSKRVSVNRLT